MIVSWRRHMSKRLVLRLSTNKSRRERWDQNTGYGPSLRAFNEPTSRSRRWLARRLRRTAYSFRIGAANPGGLGENAGDAAGRDAVRLNSCVAEFRRCRAGYLACRCLRRTVDGTGKATVQSPAVEMPVAISDRATS